MNFVEEHRSNVVYQLDHAASAIRDSRVDLGRIAFLVSEDEWTEIEAHMKRYSSITGYENFEQPLTEITYRGIEIRKR